MKRHSIFFLTLLLGMSLSSCGIYTKYSRPESLPVDSLFRDSVAGDTVSIADCPWREIFTDSCLVRWIETALDRNTDLQVARLRTEEASAALQASRLAFLPSLSLDPQAGVSYLDGSTSFSYSLGGSVSWEVDAFGKLRNSRKGSEASYLEQQAYQQAVMTSLVASVAEMYYSLIAMDKKLEITRLTLENRRESLRVMMALKESGTYTEAAVAQSRASVLEAENSLLSLDRQIRELENSFSVLVGMTPRDIGRSDLFGLTFDSPLTVGVPASLLERRPDVRQAEWKLAGRFYATNKARSSFYPSITLSGSAGWTNSAGGIVANPADWLLNAIGSLVQPIFNLGTNRANLKIAKAQQEEALHEYVGVLLTAGAEVNDALVRCESAKKRMQVDADRVENLGKALECTRSLMKYGTVNYLEVLSADSSLLQAKLEQVSDSYEYIQGIINLYHALGGGTR
ncbi:MAG: TolC family protein [Candidatus Cryptobacteroides sp.]